MVRRFVAELHGEWRGFDKLSGKRTCCRSARSVEGESGGRHSGIASPARLNWSRAVNWSLSARRMASNSGSSGFHSSIPLSRSRCPRSRSRASRHTERQLPSRKLLQVMQGEPALRHESPQLHSRLHVWHEGGSGFRLWRSRAATFGYPVSTYFGAGRHFRRFLVEFLRRRIRDPKFG
jgi:hypothetical protein